MENQSKNDKIINRISEKINNGEFNGAWLKIRIGKTGEIANLYYEKAILIED